MNRPVAEAGAQANTGEEKALTTRFTQDRSPQQDRSRSEKTHWFRWSQLAFEVMPLVLRDVFRKAWEERYGYAWIDGVNHGQLIVYGGAIHSAADIKLQGRFSVRKGHTEVRSTVDVSGVLKVGGIFQVGRHIFTVKSHGEGKLIGGDGKHFGRSVRITVHEKHTGANIDGEEGWLRVLSIPRARTHDGRRLGRHILSRLRRGIVNEWDMKTLTMALVGIVGCVVRCAPEDRVSLSLEQYASRMEAGTLAPWQVIQRLVHVRNQNKHGLVCAMSNREYRQVIKIYGHALAYFNASEPLWNKFRFFSSEDAASPGKADFSARVAEFGGKMEALYPAQAYESKNNDGDFELCAAEGGRGGGGAGSRSEGGGWRGVWKGAGGGQGGGGNGNPSRVIPLPSSHTTPHEDDGGITGVLNIVPGPAPGQQEELSKAGTVKRRRMCCIGSLLPCGMFGCCVSSLLG